MEKDGNPLMKLRPALYVSAMVVVLALAVMPVMRASAQEPSGESDAVSMKADTPADQTALANKYDKEAAAARKQAKKHRKMADWYKQFPRLAGQAEHCQNIADAYETIATQDAALAEKHRELASQPAAQ